MSLAVLDALEGRLDACLSRDRHALLGALRRLRRELREGKPGSGGAALEALQARLTASLAAVQARRLWVPAIHYPPQLPVSQRVEDIKRLLREHQVVIIAGETGSGKTTQIPKLCLELGRGVCGLIGHTQPRRLAASTVASRIASELGVAPGQQVGFQVRFTDTSHENTLIKLMTDGILLAETQHDPYLARYDTLIIDEAHERSLNIDFLLGYLKRLLPKRPDLKLIITSATIDVESFSRHFDAAPVIEVSGRTYPVELHYRPPAEQSEDLELPEQVVAAFDFIRQLERQKHQAYRDVLVFLSGEKEIRDTADLLRKQQYQGVDVLPLYARLSLSEQQRVFEAHPGRRIVLTTNVAETSLTVPGIGYVIDSGLARISRYNVRNKIQRLPVEAISQASANQRAGRCGRLGPGTCVRLYSEVDFQSRPAFTDTEITRTNLASVILQMLALKLGDIDAFPFLEAPDSRAVRDGYRLLEELQAVDTAGTLLPLGRQMARLPLDPRLARILLEAGKRHCLSEALIIVSALSVQDPRERPLEKQQAADEAHRRFWHPESDFWAFVNLWNYVEEQRQALGSKQLRKFCTSNYLSFMRVREWREVHRQLLLLCQELQLPLNHDPATYEEVHLSILSGFLGQVAWRLEEGAYLGARSRKYVMFPGSALHRKNLRWIVSAELVETSQLFARMNARVAPEWIEIQAAHLLRREYFEPHWEAKQGQVLGYEKVLLYGLTLVEKRKVNYGRVDPAIARDIFIREGLVQQQLRTRAPFYSANRAMLARVGEMEERTRRRDILVDEDTVFAFYDTRLPAEVVDTSSLERWYFRQPKTVAAALLLSEADLMRTALGHEALAQFPERLESGELKLALQYAFDPGQAHDGVSVDVPVSALKQLKAEDLDWLVPGLLREKCIALIKALPKSLRKHFVPVPDIVDKVLPALDATQGSLRSALARQLLRHSGVALPDDCWDEVSLPEHLLMNIRVLDERGQELGVGRDLQHLRETLAVKVQASISRAAGVEGEREGLTAWDFGELPAARELGRGSLRITAYPALVDHGDSVALKLFDSDYRARCATPLGIARLAIFACHQQVRYLRKELLQDPRRLPQLASLGPREQVLDHLLLRAYTLALGLDDEVPRSAEAFNSLLEANRAKVIDVAQALQKLLYQILERRHALLQTLAQRCNTLQHLPLKQDVEAQLARLIAPGFLLETPEQQLRHYPRYLHAIEQRLEKFPLQMTKDQAWTHLIQEFEQRYQERRDHCVRHEQLNRNLDEFRWLLEEFRVSLFAQQLGTRVPVSEKRLRKAWETV
ncbi:MAG: ATP-dependent RNA helicase HrpA [Pseudomonadales bacterium]|jgi:ATP-dependent helicase HrpA|nr:ATP-dependent RNA helicase HrpA [Pseudomonadales bacterium]